MRGFKRMLNPLRIEFLVACNRMVRTRRRKFDTEDREQMSKQDKPPDKAVKLVPEGELMMGIFKALVKRAESLIGQPGFAETFASLVAHCKREFDATGRWFAPPGTVGAIEDRHLQAMGAAVGKTVTLVDVSDQERRQKFAPALARVWAMLGASGFERAMGKLRRLQTERLARDGRHFAHPDTLLMLEARHKTEALNGRLTDEVETTMGTKAFEPTLAKVEPELTKIGVAPMVIDGMRSCHIRAIIHRRKWQKNAWQTLERYKDVSLYHQRRWIYASLVRLCLQLRLPRIGNSTARSEGGRILPFPKGREHADKPAERQPARTGTDG